jgi:hypothetical protein
MTKKVQEGLADLAGRAEMDHEVQMARADLYKIAKYAIKLHDMLKSVSEEQGLEGWQQAKITKAADYIGSVYHNLDYDLKFGEGVAEGKYKNDAQRKAIHASKNKKKNEDAYKSTLASKLSEKMDLKKADMGDVVKDFQKSDAPQFKGKSKKKRQQMAVAAKLGADDKK